MKKTEAIQLSDDPVSELAPIIRIGTETVLSQYPLHRLAKRSSLEIRVTKANARGKLITTWEVSASQKYGEPGPLAYKLDTILINREIDESRPNIPEVIRLGSLRDICLALGISPEGKNTQLVKKALHQNASAYITAKLDYRSKDGSERNFEFGASRYEVIFVGQKLPNGVKADAVYIILHRTFREFLSHANTRPLDYEYLKSLAPLLSNNKASINCGLSDWDSNLFGVNSLNSRLAFRPGVYHITQSGRPSSPVISSYSIFEM